MDRNFTVSVVIPTYNRKSLLLKAIDSVVKQSVLPDEIIVVDNGEQRCGINDSRIILIEAPVHAGVSQARNIGLSISQSDYVAFLDDDDSWHVDYIKNVKLAIVKEGFPDLLLSSLYDSETKIKINGKNNYESQTTTSLIRKNPGAVGSNTIVKKEVMLTMGGYDCKMYASEDIDIIIRFAKFSKKIVKLTDPIVYYNSSHTESRLSNFRNLMDGKWKLIRKHKKSNLISSVLYVDYFSRVLGSYIKKRIL